MSQSNEEKDTCPSLYAACNGKFNFGSGHFLGTKTLVVENASTNVQIKHFLQKPLLIVQISVNIGLIAETLLSFLFLLLLLLLMICLFLLILET